MKQKLLTLSLILGLAACYSKDPNPNTQSSYDRIEHELNYDKDSAYNGNPYNYQVNLDDKEESLTIERRMRAEDTFVFILMPLLIPDLNDSDSVGSFKNVKIAKAAQLNGQILLARHFSRPIQIQKKTGLTLINDNHWIEPKPLGAHIYSISQIPFVAAHMGVSVKRNRILLSYPIVGHLSPTVSKPIASSKFNIAIIDDLEENFEQYKKTVSDARASGRFLKISYDENDELVLSFF